MCVDSLSLMGMVSKNDFRLKITWDKKQQNKPSKISSEDKKENFSRPRYVLLLVVVVQSPSHVRLLATLKEQK